MHRHLELACQTWVQVGSRKKSRWVVFQAEISLRVVVRAKFPGHGPAPISVSIERSLLRKRHSHSQLRAEKKQVKSKQTGLLWVLEIKEDNFVLWFAERERREEKEEPDCTLTQAGKTSPATHAERDRKSRIKTPRAWITSSQTKHNINQSRPHVFSLNRLAQLRFALFLYCLLLFLRP